MKVGEMDFKRKEVIIFTWCHDEYANYGQVLQCYALYKQCLDWGFDVKVLRYRKLKNQENIEQIPTDIPNHDAYERELFLNEYKGSSAVLYDTFEQFINKYINTTNRCHNQDQVIEECKHADIILVGSDQVWNPSFYDPIYVPDYLGEECCLISYATSGITNEKGSRKNIIKEIAHKLKVFKAVSVRETISSELLAKYYMPKVEVVLDPTLLLSTEEWDDISSERLIKEDYMLCFCYDNFQPHKHLIKALYNMHEEIDKILLVQVDGVFERPNLLENMCIYENASPSDFISLIKHASVVCTDSFHGFAFSLKYQRQVYLLPHSNISEECISSERMKSLSNTLNLGSRWLRNKSDLKTIKQIDYGITNERLKKAIQDSKDYLITALDGSA